MALSQVCNILDMQVSVLTLPELGNTGSVNECYA